MYWHGVREYCNVYFCLNVATGTPTRHQSTATASLSTRWKTSAKMISFLGWLRSLAGTTVRGFTSIYWYKISKFWWGLHCSEVAYWLLNSSLELDNQHSQKSCRGKNIDVSEVNQGHWLVESGQWHENVDWTHLVLAFGKPLQQIKKTIYTLAYFNRCLAYLWLASNRLGLIKFGLSCPRLSSNIAACGDTCGDSASAPKLELVQMNNCKTLTIKKLMIILNGSSLKES